MATTKLSNSGTTGAKYPTASADNNYMETIASTLVGAGGASTVTFSSIPQGYKHLQLRILSRGTAAANYVESIMRFNGDSGSSYFANHQLLGNATSASSSADSTATYVSGPYSIADNISASMYSATVLDVLDYTNTSKYKTVRLLNGSDINGFSGQASYIILRSGLWMNTAAITSLSLSPSSGNWKQYSRFSLYGVKA